MNKKLFLKLQADGLISPQELEQVLNQPNKPVAVNADLKLLLYAGILMFTTGLGILIYKNIETIGHLAIVLFIAAGMIACYTYCIIKAPRFSLQKVTSPNIWFDYILLTACLLMLSLIGYLQFQYQLFGQQWGLATFIPMVILFACAYYFDHIGILSLAIVNLATWVGISVTPLHLLKDNDFSNERLIYTGILLAILLLVLAIFSQRRDIKKHFYFTYKNFSTHLLFVALLAAIFTFEAYYLLYFLLLIGAAAYHFIAARNEKSFYFLVVVTLYVFIATCYIFTHIVSSKSFFSEGSLYALLLFYIASGLALVFFLIRLNKIIKKS